MLQRPVCRRAAWMDYSDVPPDAIMKTHQMSWVCFAVSGVRGSRTIRPALIANGQLSQQLPRTLEMVASVSRRSGLSHRYQSNPSAAKTAISSTGGNPLSAQNWGLRSLPSLGMEGE